MIPRSRLTRAVIFVILAALVAFLGAAAKRSQFDGPPHSGFLSKSVKMAGAPVQPDNGTQFNDCTASLMAESPLVVDEQTVCAISVMARFTPVSLSSPPLRA